MSIWLKNTRAGRHVVIVSAASLIAVLTIGASLTPLRYATFNAEVHATAIELWLAEPSSILPPLALSEVTVGGVTRVESDAMQVTSRDAIDSSTVDVVVGKRGQIVLSDLQLPSGSHARLEWLGAPRRYRLTVFCGSSCPSRDVQLSLIGPDTVSLSGAPSAVVPSGNPRYVRVHTRGTPLAIDLAIASVLDARGLAQYALDSVRFHRIERVVGRDGMVRSRVLSSVIQAEVSFASLPGAVRVVRQNETLDIHGRHIDLRSLQLSGDTLVAGVSGVANALVGGLAGADRSIVPTILEAVLSNSTIRAFVLLVTTTIAWAANLISFCRSKDDGNSTT